MKTIVIGGGPAGIMAALTAAEYGEVTLIEQNEKLGKKLYITGKGRCNVTNNCLPQEFLESVVRGQKFLRSAIYSFSPANTIELLEGLGLKTKTERGNRVFPISDKASDVTRTLERELVNRGVKICLNTRAASIIVSDDAARGIKTAENTQLYADKIIVATGGLSYADTGSNGDGLRFAKTLGIALTPTVPALTGIETDKTHLSAIQGLSLKNVAVSIKNGTIEAAREFGEMLFTHYGVSGPAVITLSSRINRLPVRGLVLCIDLKPALDHKQLDERVIRDFAKFANKAYKNSLDELLPKSLISVIIKLSGIDGDKKVNQITAAERKKIVEVLKCLEFPIRGLRGYEEAIVTSGGIDTREVNPKNMESRKIKNLHFVGEVLDIDALTGGFNIQLALSTGYLAGKNEK